MTIQYPLLPMKVYSEGFVFPKDYNLPSKLKTALASKPQNLTNQLMLYYVMVKEITPCALQRKQSEQIR
jgi:hypothetical protein